METAGMRWLCQHLGGRIGQRSVVGILWDNQEKAKPLSDPKKPGNGE
jgi:hypothetical protein